MSKDLYSIIQEKGPEALVGMRFDLNGTPHEITSLKAIGGSMIVYNLRNLETMGENRVLKIPRARPGSPEHDQLMRSTRLAMERIPDLIAPTQLVRVQVSGQPDKSPTTKGDALERLVTEALIALHRRDFREANTKIDQALHLHPDNTRALFNKGIILFAEEKLDEALGYFERVLEQNASDTNALTYRGEVFFYKNDLKSAFKVFQTIINIDGSCIHGWIGLGKVLGSIGQFSKALTCFQQALRIDPKNKEASDFLKRTTELSKRTKA